MKSNIDLERIYSLFPIWLQNITVSYEGWKLKKRRFKKKYIEVYNEVSRRKLLNKSDLRDYQDKRLREFLKVTYMSPFWKNRFKEFNLNLRSSNIFQEIKKLPIIQKHEVKENIKGFINPTISKSKFVKMHTSGTTGSGLIFYITKQAEIEWQATIWRHYNHHGINLNTWRGYFTGRSLVPLKQKKPPYWRINIPGRRLMFDAYHLNKKTAKSYVAALRKYDISCLYGYPSFISLLAGYMLDEKIPPIETINVILTSSETLMPQQKSLIEKAFGVNVFQHYGVSELTAQFSECEHGRMHVDEDFSIVEFIPLGNSDNSYRVIGTGFINHAFPLVRYDCGDIVKLAEGKCACGNTGRIVKEVDGRIEDYIVLKDGTKIGRLDHIFKDLTFIREAQFYQNKPGKVIIRVVKGTDYDNSNGENKLLAETIKRLGNETKINIEYIGNIPKTKSGKLRFVISKINL